VTGRRNSKRPRWRGFVAGILAALWLFTGFAAASAELHHCLHEDAPASDHQCLFTKYAEGQFVDAPTETIALDLSPKVFALEQPFATIELPSVLSLLPPGRAPPLL
jgi:hypothetical protein